MTRICSKHGVSYMPSGTCYYCNLEGTKNEQVSAEHSPDSDFDRNGDSAPSSSASEPSSGSVGASGNSNDDTQPLAAEPRSESITERFASAVDRLVNG